ncbi:MULTISPECIES: helix-turn-helix domain-containing protein [Trichocoleus]|uniref:Uncharacterized protein n=1 Tax=Trichocoleus desertorum GB2-A4 TaxID=2933944 RepID=A0ABV0JDI0_9CYAN|nr:helix-turn-helix domain-containing protein [Trichocoleus sp. FACHB-46]MBD1863994.1 helix-turn-helix domain-containing protein [Trichocoleus sp. FACHB-46]
MRSANHAKKANATTLAAIVQFAVRRCGSLHEAGRRTRVSRAAIASICNGKTQLPRRTTLRKIAPHTVNDSTNQPYSWLDLETIAQTSLGESALEVLSSTASSSQSGKQQQLEEMQPVLEELRGSIHELAVVLKTISNTLSSRPFISFGKPDNNTSTSSAKQPTLGERCEERKPTFQEQSWLALAIADEDALKSLVLGCEPPAVSATAESRIQKIVAQVGVPVQYPQAADAVVTVYIQEDLTTTGISCQKILVVAQNENQGFGETLKQINYFRQELNCDKVILTAETVPKFEIEGFVNQGISVLMVSREYKG